MGSLDKQGTEVVRKIKFVNVTGFTTDQIENAFNNNYGKVGWRIIQVFDIGSNRFLLAEKEV